MKVTTGSTIGPILVSELISRGENVIVMMIGSTSSRKETENTIASLQSYESISQRRGKPVILHYRENSAATPRGRIDADLQVAIVLLASVYSGSNRELDTADLSNFLNYHKVTTYQPRLSFLDFFTREVQVGKGQSLISLVTLVDNDTSSDIDTPVEYQSVGFLPDSTQKLIPSDLPIHLCVISGYFNTIMDVLKSRASEFEEARSVVIEKLIIAPDQAATHDGLVF